MLKQNYFLGTQQYLPSATNCHLFVSIHLFHVLIFWPVHSFPIAFSALFIFSSVDLTIYIFYPDTLSVSFLIVPNITFFVLVPFFVSQCFKYLLYLVLEHHLERANNQVSSSPSPQPLTQLIQRRHLNIKSSYRLPFGSNKR